MNLNETVSFSEIIKWRLHWLICHINFEIIDQMHKRYTVEQIDSFVTVLRDQVSKKDRLFWEIATIESMDNHQYDVEKALEGESLLKYELFLKTVAKAKKMLQDKLVGLQEEQMHNMFACIHQF